MFQVSSFRIPFWGGGRTDTSQKGPIAIKSVPIHNIETSPERNTRTLKHLLKANHTNNSILFHNLQFHNHAPHILGSAWILGSSPEHLTKIYDSEVRTLEPWKDAPGEIAAHDWRDFLGKKEYQRAFIDFFEDELARMGYDWEALVQKYLFHGDQPLFNGIICGLAHPLIHLGYGSELHNREVSVEALTMTACCYNDLHKYLDDKSYTRPSPLGKKTVTEIIELVAGDGRLKKGSGASGDQEEQLISSLMANESVVLDYWNAWDLTDPKAQFQECQRLAAALLVETVREGQLYDFFLVHLLTSSHAARILLPLIPGNFQMSLLRQWWFFTLTTYIDRGKPVIDWNMLENFDTKGRQMSWATQKALQGRWSTDAHYVKAIRALAVAANDWDGEDQWFLKAALKFAKEFDDWGFD